jgi:dUTP pyrophosphatase
MKIKIINKSPNKLPKYHSTGASGMDIQANTHEVIILKSFERKIINTGLYIELPKYYEAQIRSRSGLAIKHGIICLNSPGTIDSDYRGEILIILINLSLDNFLIHPGDRIAQIIFSKYQKITWEKTKSLNTTLRNEKGVGSTGL